MSTEVLMEAPFPPELLGRKREDVNLLVIRRTTGETITTGFRSLPEFINPGDVLVFNNSSLVRASLPVYFPDLSVYGSIHVGNSRNGKRQLVEIRPMELNQKIKPNTTAQLIGTSGMIKFNTRHSVFPRFFWAYPSGNRDLLEIAEEAGKVIRYGHIPFDLPESYYENETGTVPGSVEYPSAARPFTKDVLKNIRTRGAKIMELTLHCNLGSLEPHEFAGKDLLLDEQFKITRETADAMKQAKLEGNRVIAVGTSVVRALESAFNGREVLPGKYSTELYIHGDYRFNFVDAIVTGMHEEQGSHIGMISAFTGDSMLRSAYERASAAGFSWHEFGDLALIA